MKERLQPCLCCLHGHAGFQTAEDLCPAEAIIVQSGELPAWQVVSHRDRYADLWGTARLDSVESCLAHTDNRQCSAVYHDLLAHDVGIRREPRTPISVTEHGQGMTALNEIIRCVED